MWCCRSITRRENTANTIMGVPSWLEVSLIVDGEMAEAVSEVMARFVSGGVVIESTAIVADAEDEGRAQGPLRVCGYLPLDGEWQQKRRRLEEAFWHLGRIRPLPEAQFKTVREVDWAESWKAHFQPVNIGERLLIIPSWLEAADRARIPVRIDPGMAFGTGTHPSTQLCLELLEKYIRKTKIPDDKPDEISVIDVGCGSGILAVAALKLGASRALAVDLDPEAIQATRQNAFTNGVIDRLDVGQGSVAEIRAGEFSFQQANVVVANILAPVLTRLLGQGLGDLLSQDGVLILSGILAEQVAEVEAAAKEHGFHLVDHRQAGDWVALVIMENPEY